MDNIPRGSPTESQASSNESWRQALFGGGRSCSPRGGVLQQHDEIGGSPIVDDEQGLGLHLGEEACQEEEEEEAVESMNVKDLKAKATELGIPTGGRKCQLKARIKHKLSASRPSSEVPPAAATTVQSEMPEVGGEVAQAVADGYSAVDGSQGSASAVAQDADTSPIVVGASWDAGTGGQEGEGRSGGASPSTESGGAVADQSGAAREGRGTTPGDGPGPSLVAVAAPPAEEDDVPASGGDDYAGTLPSGVAAVWPPEDGGGVLHPPGEVGGGEEMGEPAGGAAGLQAEEGGPLDQEGGDGDGRGCEGAADAQGSAARGQQEGIVREEMVVNSLPAVVGPTPSVRESPGSAGAVSTGPGSDAEGESGDGITAAAAAAAAVASGSTAPSDRGVISADSSGGVVAYGGRAEAGLSALESDDGEDVVDPEPVENDDEMTEGYAVGEVLVRESGGVDGAGEESGVRYREVVGSREVGGDWDRQGERREDGGSGGEGGDGQRGEEEEEVGCDSEEESLIFSAAAGEPVMVISRPTVAEHGGAAGQSGIEEGAGDSGKEEEVVVVVVVPTAEELTEKYLEVERLWRPILLNSGLADGGGGGTNTPLPIGELLLETEAFKEKARVLAAWFHQDAGPADRRCSKSSAASSVDWSKSGRGAGGSAGGTGWGAGGATAAAARKTAGVVGAGVEASTTTQRSAATGTSAMARSRRGSTASTSEASSRPSESGGWGSKGRLGKSRGSRQRLSVSPPRAKVSAAAAARVGAGRRPSGGKGMPAAAKTSSATAAPSSLRKRNPLIRASSSSPRPPRASVSRPTGGEGVAKRNVGTRRSGRSVAGSAAGRLKGAPLGNHGSVVGGLEVDNQFFRLV
ncbi:unnamed protein product [Ectocarpus sp. CCAP 1310/34]|nr:unnamed protein product [Ectocarpus sp. CCAP 1310/34]